MEAGQAGDHRVTVAELTVELPDGVAGPLDVLFDGRRIWSVGEDQCGPGLAVLAWPAALLPYLQGETQIALRVPATGEVVAVRDVRFGESAGRVAVVDADGVFLVVNKWGRLSRSLEGRDLALTRLLDDSSRVLGLLGELGVDAYLVGGSLLGAMRSGDFLAHDDDVDIAYLSSYSSPADLSLESYRIQRHLEAAGHVVIRHSSAHIQVLFYGPGSAVEHYVDIFTAFYKDGVYCQPFALRGRLDVEKVLPTSTVTLRGRELPAPAVPSAWLELAYGRWETPDPSFRFVTPEATTRRFHAWFGAYQAGREFWSDWLGDRVATSARESDEARELAGRVGEHDLVLELGAGTGADARFLADLGHEVWAVDYAVQYGRPPFPGVPGLRYRMGNLAETRDLLRLAVEARAHGAPTVVYGRDVLAGLVPPARANVLLLMASLPTFRAGWFTFDTDLPPWYLHEDPTTWHLPLEVFEAECAAAGLRSRAVRQFERSTPAGPRGHAVVEVRRP